MAAEYDAGEMAEWMRHGISLCADMLWAADELIHRGQISAVDKRRLQKELAIRNRVAAKFAGGEVTLSPAEMAWRAYILKHCGLEIQRARGEIDQAGFLAACDQLRAERKLTIFECMRKVSNG